MTEITSIVENKIRLNSGMGEMAFGKTNYDSIISQKGVLAVCDSAAGEECHFNFEDWSFNEVKAFEVPGKTELNVFYCGDNPLSSKAQTFSSLFFEGKDSAEIYKAGLILCTILTQAAKEKLDFPVEGAGGILLDDLDTAKPKVLFLPPNLFKYSAGGLSPQNQLEIHNGWLNPTLFDLPAICFQRSIIAYSILTNRLPFAAADTTERNADILDRKFLPAELAVNGIEPKLASEINRGLKLNSNAVTIPGKKTKGKKSEDLTPSVSFPLDLLQEAHNKNQNTKLTDEELEQKAKNYMKSVSSSVNAKRRIRRNSTIILTAAIVLIVVGIFTASSIKSSLESPSSRGLTSEQTVQAFYKGVNLKDVVLIQNMIKGKTPNNYLDTVSSIYVIGKNRMTYNHDQGFMSAEGYFIYATNVEKSAQAGIYGVSNLKIDGKSYDLNPELHDKIEKIPPLTVEKNITLTEGMKSVHSVNYYLLHTETEENDIEAEYITDTMTLTYHNKRWLITDISTKSEPLELDSNSFKSDFFRAVANNDDDVIKACNLLRSKYPFIPDTQTLQREKDHQDELAADPYAILNGKY